MVSAILHLLVLGAIPVMGAGLVMATARGRRLVDEVLPAEPREDRC
jgi:hypothetical protein